ncbi:MAG: M3 family metallopeptidase, partial [Paracoccaceae bacterium]|nr:M3 family metallopeptidase [Paracoccaceae bacterium]
MNILNQPWKELFELPAFEKIIEEDFLPALIEAISFAAQNLERISSTTDSPSFINTIEALEEFDEVLSRLSALFFNLASSNSNEKLEAIQIEFVTRVSKFYSKVFMNKKIFSRIDMLHDFATTKKSNFTYEQKRVLNHYWSDYIRSGVQLSEKNQLKLRKITTKLAELGAKFSQNILAEERLWELELSEKDLDGLPYDLISILKQSGLERGSSLPILTLSRSHLVPFLESSSRRDLRKKAHSAWISRGANNNVNNNYEIIKEIILLRKDRANLLGFENFSEFKLENEMAENPNNVKNFLQNVWKYAHVKALEELEEVKQIMQDEKVDGPVMPWDWRYYQSKVKKQRFDFNPEDLKPFFELNSMIEAAFFVAKKLFKLEFTSVQFVGYHPDVRTWQVSRRGIHIGVFIGDYFARDGKRSGAWCSSLRSQSRNKKVVTPIVLNVCNFAKPPQNDDPLLSFDDATTLFHEFGHALHNLLSNVTYDRISGTSVARDFVELPSQLYEHWLLTPEVLEKFAINKENGESMPQELKQKLLNSVTFGSGFAT